MKFSSADQAVAFLAACLEPPLGGLPGNALRGQIPAPGRCQRCGRGRPERGAGIWLCTSCGRRWPLEEVVEFCDRPNRPRERGEMAMRALDVELALERLEHWARLVLILHVALPHEPGRRRYQTVGAALRRHFDAPKTEAGPRSILLRLSQARRDLEAELERRGLLAEG